MVMIYNTLEASVYFNSRYALIQLFEDVLPTKHGTFENIATFDLVANTYEMLLDEHFPALPLSEERLAIFSRVYSDNGLIPNALIQAVESLNRLQIYAVLCEADNNSLNQGFIKNRRRFYEAEVFRE